METGTVNLLVTNTGWWGIPGKVPQGDSPKVHAVFEGKPICGQKIDPRAEYQWCAHGLRFDYVDCEKCKQIIGLRSLNLWQQTGPGMWEREDGAYVKYANGLMGPETNITLPGHRGWVAFAPDRRSSHTYLGYFPRRWRRGGVSQMYVPRKFKTALSAIRTLDYEYPYIPKRNAKS